MTRSALQEMTDSDLARRCRRGDERAWDELVRRTSPTVWRVALRVLRSRPEAEEASQEAFTRIVRAFDTFDPTRPLKPWVSRITYHVCLKRLSRAGPAATTEISEISLASGQLSPEAHVGEGQVKGLLEDAVSRLPAQDRALLTMHYREELTMAEVSEATGMPTGTIKARLSRARARLRRMLAPRLGGMSDG